MRIFWVEISSQCVMLEKTKLQTRGLGMSRASFAFLILGVEEPWRPVRETARIRMALTVSHSSETKRKSMRPRLCAEYAENLWISVNGTPTHFHRASIILSPWPKAAIRATWTTSSLRIGLVTAKNPISYWGTTARPKTRKRFPTVFCRSLVIGRPTEANRGHTTLPHPLPTFPRRTGNISR